MELFLGIDTSCYTTSLALMNSEGNLFSQARRLLTVPGRGRGLAQNEAVFQHIANIPALIKELLTASGIPKLACVAASTRPRPAEGSYMPVFRVAESFGQSVASLFNIPFIETTHQEGHIAAGLWSAKFPGDEEFLTVHLSGGTTEVLKVRKGLPESRNFYDIELIGGSADLHAGQLVDRIGVALGLPFPAGPYLEKLAGEATGGYSIPSSVKGYSISFSGPEAAAMRMIDAGVPAREVARAVEKCIAISLEKVIKKAIGDTGLNTVLVVGGVAANTFLRGRIINNLQRNTGVRLYFAEPALSSDNAVGVAIIGMNRLRTL